METERNILFIFTQQWEAVSLILFKNDCLLISEIIRGRGLDSMGCVAPMVPTQK